ncbi:MAG: hypothetical protein E7571_05460 [Ruminococcaceae bacterium]|nr:hypothetical protein [Oscillospiraceae bacterium]
MNRDFILKITVLPFILGIICTIIAVTFFSLKSETFVPVYKGTVLSYYEDTADVSKVSDKPLDEAVAGDCIGKIVTDTEIPIVADAPYHMLDTAVSYESGSAQFGKAGYIYFKTDGRILNSLKKSISFSVKQASQQYSYVLVETKHFDTADAVKAYAPDINRGIILWSQDSADLGLKESYTALIFEEVQI